MTVFLVTVIKRFIGEAHDAKPTVGVPPGSTFFETDTKMSSTYTGTAWSYDVLNPVYGIHAVQGIKITEEEEEWQTAYIVGAASQVLRYSEGRSVVVSLPLASANDRTKISEAITMHMMDNISSIQRLAIVESGQIAVT
jgi:hypothetical protein